MNQLIVIEQPLVIKARLEGIMQEVQQKLDGAMQMTCSNDGVQAVKKTRAELNKIRAEIEEKRITAKKIAEEPYNQFMAIYKSIVTEPFEKADKALKAKIFDTEHEIKSKKEQEVKSYFDEYAQSLNIDFVEFARAEIKVGLTNSMKSLKDAAKTFLDQIKADVMTIETHDEKAEIMYEYKKTLNAFDAISVVMKRNQELGKAQEAQAEKTPPPANRKPAMSEPEELLHYSLRISGTKTQLKKLKEFLESEGMDYEQIG